MNTHDTPANGHAQPGKRRLLLAIGGGSIGLSQWVKPAINTVLTPAHAQTSGLSVTFTTTTGSTAAAVGTPVGITANVTGGNGTYFYEWTVKSPTGAVIAEFGGDQSPGATLTYTQVAGGLIIEVLVDDSAGTRGTETLNLTVGGFVPRPGGGGGSPTPTSTELTVTLAQSPDTFKILNNVAVTFTATASGGGSSPDYRYMWNTGIPQVNETLAPDSDTDNQLAFQESAAGVYTIKVTVIDASLDPDNPHAVGTTSTQVEVLAPSVTTPAPLNAEFPDSGNGNLVSLQILAYAVLGRQEPNLMTLLAIFHLR